MSQTQVQVTPTLSSVVRVTETDSQVTITRAPNANVVTVTATGPQGPSFAGSSFMDTAAIDALTSGDQGKVLEWNGSVFSPTNVLDDDLTLHGGAF
jgi:multidrug efflux pump subunit AcrB